MELKVLKRAVKTTPIANIDFMRNIDMSLFVALTRPYIHKVCTRVSNHQTFSLSCSFSIFLFWVLLVLVSVDPAAMESALSFFFSSFLVFRSIVDFNLKDKRVHSSLL